MTPAKKIDATPTWAGILPVYLDAIASGNEPRAKPAREELYRMAKAADTYNEKAAIHNAYESDVIFNVVYWAEQAGEKQQAIELLAGLFDDTEENIKTEYLKRV